VSETNWTLREAVQSDAPSLTKCMTAAYSAYESRMEGTRLPPMDVHYEREIRESPTWVVVESGQVIGALIMGFSDDHAKIANVAVHPAHQGRGIGGRLMRLAEESANEQGHSEMRLATHVLLTENVSLYEHLGWREIKRDETRVWMAKTI